MKKVRRKKGKSYQKDRDKSRLDSSFFEISCFQFRPSIRPPKLSDHHSGFAGTPNEPRLLRSDSQGRGIAINVRWLSSSLALAANAFAAPLERGLLRRR